MVPVCMIFPTHLLRFDALVKMSGIGNGSLLFPTYSIYLVGHQSVQATDQYVRLTAAMYRTSFNRSVTRTDIFFLLLSQMKPL